MTKRKQRESSQVYDSTIELFKVCYCCYLHLVLVSTSVRAPLRAASSPRVDWLNVVLLLPSPACTVHYWNVRETTAVASCTPIWILRQKSMQQVFAMHIRGASMLMGTLRKRRCWRCFMQDDVLAFVETRRAPCSRSSLPFHGLALATVCVCSPTTPTLSH